MRQLAAIGIVIVLIVGLTWIAGERPDLLPWLAIPILFLGTSMFYAGDEWRGK